MLRNEKITGMYFGEITDKQSPEDISLDLGRLTQRQYKNLIEALETTVKENKTSNPSFGIYAKTGDVAITMNPSLQTILAFERLVSLSR